MLRIFNLVLLFLVLLTGAGIVNRLIEEPRHRLFVETRLNAVLAVNTRISKVTGVYFKYSKDKTLSTECGHKKYQEALDEVREVINRNEVLFPLEVNEDVTRLFEVHRALMNVGFPASAQYRPFIADLSNQTDQLFQAVLAHLEKSPGTPFKNLPRLKLAPVPFEERDKLTSLEYLDKHLQYWKDHAGK